MPALALVRSALLLAAFAGEPVDPSLGKEIETYLADADLAGGGAALRAFWREGPRIESADGTFRLHPGGRVFFDSAWISSDDLPGTSTGDTAFFRSVRLSLDGTIHRNALFKVEVDFATGEVILRDVYAGLARLPAGLAFRAGHFREPLGFEELMSALHTSFLERSAATTAFVPERNVGLALEGSFGGGGPVAFAAGVFRDSDDQGRAEGDGGYAVTGRLAGSFLDDGQGTRAAHAGLGFTYRDPAEETVRFRARPDIGTGPRFVDTGDYAADTATVVGFELAALVGRFHAQAEAFLAETGGAGSPDARFSGWYVEAGWFVAGGRRTYDAARKIFGRPHLDRRLGDGGAGAFAVAVRFDAIDLEDGAISGGRQECVTLGILWYWNPHMRVLLNWIHADVSGGAPLGDGALDIVATRFQVDF